MEIISKTLSLMWQRKMIVGVIGLIIAGGNYVAAIFFNGIESIYRGAVITSDVLDVTIYSFAPAGSLAVVGLAMFIEVRKLGWEKSSINKILNADTISAKTDLFYTVLYASNIIAILGYLFTLGISYHISGLIREGLGLSLLTNSGIFITLPVLLLSNSLMFYIFHKIAHTRFLWELHKTHHAATHMHIVTNFRSHPFAAGLKAIFLTFPVAILGVPPIEFIVYYMFAGFIVLMQHTDMDWDLPFIEKYILIGAAGHRLHHSLDHDHQQKNLGYVVLWDWLFGTLYRDDEAKITIGIDDDVYYVQNSGNLKTELWGIYAQTIKSFFREVRATFA